MSFKHIKIGKDFPEIINTVIEIPKKAGNKYEYDEEMDEIKIDRVFHSSMHYPLDYGFIPGTRGDDGDHLDVLLVISSEIFPGCVVSARPIGVADMEDENGQDWKIIAVAERDPRLSEIKELEDMGEHFQKEVQHFFEEYKRLENKKVEFKKWLGRKEAYEIIKIGKEKYDREG